MTPNATKFALIENIERIISGRTIAEFAHGTNRVCSATIRILNERGENTVNLDDVAIVADHIGVTPGQLITPLLGVAEWETQDNLVLVSNGRWVGTLYENRASTLGPDAWYYETTAWSCGDRKIFSARTLQKAKTGLEDVTVYDQYKRK